MTIQDVAIGKEVIYQASHSIIVGKIRGLGQLSNGTRIAIIETSAQHIFVGDIQHMFDPQDLRDL